MYSWKKTFLDEIIWKERFIKEFTESKRVINLGYLINSFIYITDGIIIIVCSVLHHLLEVKKN